MNDTISLLRDTLAFFETYETGKARELQEFPRLLAQLCFVTRDFMNESSFIAPYNQYCNDITKMVHYSKDDRGEISVSIYAPEVLENRELSKASIGDIYEQGFDDDVKTLEKYLAAYLTHEDQVSLLNEILHWYKDNIMEPSKHFQCALPSIVDLLRLLNDSVIGTSDGIAKSKFIDR